MSRIQQAQKEPKKRKNPDVKWLTRNTRSIVVRNLVTLEGAAVSPLLPSTLLEVYSVTEDGQIGDLLLRSDVIVESCNPTWAFFNLTATTDVAKHSSDQTIHFRVTSSSSVDTTILLSQTIDLNKLVKFQYNPRYGTIGLPINFLALNIDDILYISEQTMRLISSAADSSEAMQKFLASPIVRLQVDNDDDDDDDSDSDDDNVDNVDNGDVDQEKVKEKDVENGKDSISNNSKNNNNNNRSNDNKNKNNNNNDTEGSSESSRLRDPAALSERIASSNAKVESLRTELSAELNGLRIANAVARKAEKLQELQQLLTDVAAAEQALQCDASMLAADAANAADGDEIRELLRLCDEALMSRQEADRVLENKRKELLKGKFLLEARQLKLLSDLQTIYPIEQLDSGEFAIRGLELPADLQSKDDEQIAAALGYVVHLLVLASKYLEVPLRYQLLFMGSRSFIKDPVQGAVGGTFPLFKRNVEKERFDRAINWLKRDVEQLLLTRSVHYEPGREILFNLHQLFYCEMCPKLAV